jgi:hypothetical protein
MALQDEQITAENSVLLGRVIAAVLRVAAEYHLESPATPGHAERAELARRVLMDRQAPKYGSAILRIAVATIPALQQPGANVPDQNVIDFVAQRMAAFAVEGW